MSDKEATELAVMKTVSDISAFMGQELLAHNARASVSSLDRLIVGFRLEVAVPSTQEDDTNRAQPVGGICRF